MSITPPSLPTRNRTKKEFVERDYMYSYILGNQVNIDTIKSIVISRKDLESDMSLFLGLIKNSRINIKCLDFDTVTFLNKILHNFIENKVYLIDDGLLLDRSYIDLTSITNLKVIVPFTYLMWGLKFNNEVLVYEFKFANPNFSHYSSANGNEKIAFSDFMKIRKKLEDLSNEGTKSDVDKILLVSDYIQSSTQYIDAFESKNTRGIFITPDFPEWMVYRRKSGLVETVLNENNGVCMGIANLSTLLLNNDIFKIETESVFGEGHVWNKVLVNGRYYYFDNTWAITRSNNPHEDALITKSFDSQYLLFGSSTARSIGHHTPESAFIYNNCDISYDNIKLVGYESKFVYPTKPYFRSYRKKS